MGAGQAPTNMAGVPGVEVTAPPCRSGRTRPFRAFRFGRGFRQAVRVRDGENGRGHRAPGKTRLARQNRDEGSVTEPAIRIDAREPGIRFVVTRSLMLMIMMPEVSGRLPGFVLAIGAHRGPTELGRNEDEEKNGKPATHGPGF